MTDVRPMTVDDVDDVISVVQAAHDAEPHDDEPVTPTDEQREAVHLGMHRFVERDPDGAWVAVDGDTVIGMAEAIRRDAFWGLAMLFVHPAAQSRGVGRRLLDKTLVYAEGAKVRMILTSLDPRALRRYALAGLAIHPAVEASGTVDRTTIPAGLPGRPGDVDDLGLVADVDERLRGSRAEDVEFLLRTGARMEVVDHGGSRGFAVYRSTRLLMVGATDETTAAQVLWRALAETEGKAEIWGLTAAQNWAVRVALAARMKVVGSGPLFLDGLAHPPGPWVPSGWYF
jgi:GNAT superfamily N-acetyltransferase